MAETVRAIICSKSAISLQREPVDPKFQVEGVAPHQPFFFSENWAKWSFVWCKYLDRSFFRFVTIHAFVRRTDGPTAFSSLDRVCIPCSAVKILQQARSVGIERGAWGAQIRRRPPPNPPDRGWHGG